MKTSDVRALVIEPSAPMLGTDAEGLEMKTTLNEIP
jgi:hypothetical protein